MILAKANQYGGLHFSQKPVSGIEIKSTGPIMKLQLTMKRHPGGERLGEDPVRKIFEVEDIFVVGGYEWEAP